MKTVYMLALFIFFIGASKAAEDSDELNKTAENYIVFNETYRLNAMNNQVGNEPSGDIITAGGAQYTVYLLFRGWPAMQCNAGKDPNTVGECFVDEGVNLKDTLLYSAGIKSTDSGISTSFEIGEERLLFDNISGMATLSLQTFVHWKKQYCESSGDSFYCWTEGGIWEDWLSISRPTPIKISYNKTQKIAIMNYSWGLVVNTSLVMEKFGFELVGHASKCSLELISNPFNKSDCSKNETISASVSQISPYFRVKWNEGRQLYYGEMIDPAMPPYLEKKGIAIVYNTSSRQTEQILLPEGGTIDEAYVITPFGKKPVNLNVTVSMAKSNISTVITVWLIIGVLVLSFGLMLKER